jgi:hypothetical protein
LADADENHPENITHGDDTSPLRKRRDCGGNGFSNEENATGAAEIVVPSEVTPSESATTSGELEHWEIPGSSFKALQPKSLSNSTKPSTPEVQKSTNLKSELWCFHHHRGLAIFGAVGNDDAYRRCVYNK